MRIRYSILLIGLLVIPFTSVWLHLTWERLQWKVTVRERLLQELPDDLLVTMKIHVHDPALRWIETREFRYGDHRYDVVQLQIVRDTIWIKCLADDQEDLLEEKMEELLATSRDHRSDSPSSSVIRLMDLFNQIIDPGNSSEWSGWNPRSAQPSYSCLFIEQYGCSPEVPPPDSRV